MIDFVQIIFISLLSHIVTPGSSYWTQIKPKAVAGTNLQTSSNPRWLSGHSIAYYPESNQLLAYGGISLTSGNFKEYNQNLYSFSFDSLRWSISPTSPVNSSTGSNISSSQLGTFQVAPYQAVDLRRNRLFIYGFKSYDYDSFRYNMQFLSVNVSMGLNSVTQLPLMPTPIPIVWYPCLQYDSYADRIILYGGLGTSTVNGQYRTIGRPYPFWLYYPDVNGWVLETPLLQPPDHDQTLYKYGHACAINDMNGLFYSHGGISPPSSALHQYNFTSGNWTEVHAGTRSQRLYLHYMVYSDNKLFLFFGSVYDELSKKNNYIYELDLERLKLGWVPVESVLPALMSGSSFYYDSVTNRAFLHSGNDDLWTLDVGALPSASNKLCSPSSETCNCWSQMNVQVTNDSIITPRQSPAVFFSGSSEILYLFGGDSEEGSMSDLYQSTWTLFNISTLVWTPIKLNPLIRPRKFMGHLYSDIYGFIIYGGIIGDTVLNDIWICRTSSSSTFLYFSSSITSSTNTWTQLGFGVSARYGHRMFSYSYGATFYVYGGVSETDQSLSDLWYYSVPQNITSSMITSNPLVAPNPSARSFHALYAQIFDSIFSFYIHGGKNQSGTVYQDLWTYSIFPFRGWNLMDPGSEKVQLWGHSIYCNVDLVSETTTKTTAATAHVLHLFFGSYENGSVSSNIYQYRDLVNNTDGWQLLTVSYEPLGRTLFSLVYHTGAMQYMIFGGWNGTSLLNDTWNIVINTTNVSIQQGSPKCPDSNNPYTATTTTASELSSYPTIRLPSLFDQSYLLTVSTRVSSSSMTEESQTPSGGDELFGFVSIPSLFVESSSTVRLVIIVMLFLISIMITVMIVIVIRKLFVSQTITVGGGNDGKFHNNYSNENDDYGYKGGEMELKTMGQSSSNLIKSATTSNRKNPAFFA